MPLIPKIQPPYYTTNQENPTVKVYTALLSQDGTDAPTVIVLQNTYGVDIIWTRDSTGYYIGTAIAQFPANKTFIQGSCTNTGAGGNYLGPGTTTFYSYQLGRQSDDEIYLISQDGLTGTVTDLSGTVGATGQLGIEIKTYS